MQLNGQSTPPREKRQGPPPDACPRAPARACRPAPRPPAFAARRSPVDELEARLLEPEEGPFLYGLEQRVIYPTLIERVTAAGERIVTVLHEYDHPELWRAYEDLEAEIGWVRERASFTLGWEHGSADGRAEVFRSHAPALSKRAKRLADQARALVANGQMSPVEAAALLLETTWAVLLTKPAPAFEG